MSYSHIPDIPAQMHIEQVGKLVDKPVNTAEQNEIKHREFEQYDRSVDYFIKITEEADAKPIPKYTADDIKQIEQYQKRVMEVLKSSK